MLEKPINPSREILKGEINKNLETPNAKFDDLFNRIKVANLIDIPISMSLTEPKAGLPNTCFSVISGKYSDPWLCIKKEELVVDADHEVSRRDISEYRLFKTKDQGFILVTLTPSSGFKNVRNLVGDELNQIFNNFEKRLQSGIDFKNQKRKKTLKESEEFAENTAKKEANDMLQGIDNTSLA